MTRRSIGRQAKTISVHGCVRQSGEKSIKLADTQMIVHNVEFITFGMHGQNTHAETVVSLS